MRIAIIGAGSWGSAIAWLLGTKGIQVNLWARNADIVASINATRRNPCYLADSVFPQTIVATHDLSVALAGADAVVLATPSAAARQTAQALSATGLVPQETPLIILSKGIEHATGMTMLEVLEDVLGARERLAVLSGPNHAEEVARGILSATLIAAYDAQIARFFQALFVTPSFRVYTSDDVVGVQLCAAAKNVIAIAAGVLAGLGYGDNTMAMLITRGLAEISRLVKAAGGQTQTCMGLAGMGDLIVTCASEHSRNRSFGVALSTGQTLEEYQRVTHMVVEGAFACRTIPHFADELGVEVPISRRVRAVVWENQPVDDMITELMERPTKPEFY